MKRIIAPAVLVIAASLVASGQIPTPTAEKPVTQEKAAGQKMAASGVPCF